MNNMQNEYWESHWKNPKYRRLSMDQAITIAVGRVPGEVVKAELEYENGALVYEIEIRTAQGVKYEVDVDAVSGEILKVKLD